MVPARNEVPDNALLAAYQKLDTFGLVWKSRELVIGPGMLGSGIELFTLTGRAALDVYVRLPRPGLVTDPAWRGRLQVYAVGGEVEVLVAEALVQFPFEEGRFLRLRDKYAPRWRVRFKLDVIPPDIQTPFKAEFLATAFGESNTLPPVYQPFFVPDPVQTATLSYGPVGLSSFSCIVDPVALVPQFVGLYDTDPAIPVFNSSTLRQRWTAPPGGQIQWHGLATVPYRTGLVLFVASDLAFTPGANVACWGQLDRTAELEVTMGTP